MNVNNSKISSRPIRIAALAINEGRVEGTQANVNTNA